MNLYLDDGSAGALLVRLLRVAGHDVLILADINFAGRDDPEHMMEAVRRSRVLLTHNHKDFEQLHELILIAGGHHPGILVVRKDNDSKRDLSERGIVRAIRNLLASGVTIEDDLHILNYYR
jgi:hypothetical protein